MLNMDSDLRKSPGSLIDFFCFSCYVFFYCNNFFPTINVVCSVSVRGVPSRQCKDGSSGHMDPLGGKAYERVAWAIPRTRCDCVAN